MAKMSKTQSDYAVQRLKSAHEKRIQAVKAAHLTPGKTLTFDEKWALVCNGDAPVRTCYETSSPARYKEWHNVFEFSGFESEDRMSDEGERLLADVAQQYRAAMDELMLGDAEGALEAIRAFEGGV